MSHLDTSLRRLIIIVILIIINILSLYFYIRIDLTKTKAYTLSRATVTTFNDLEDVVRIRLFISKNLPAQLNSIKNYTNDLLTEYATISRGMVQYEFINPESEEKFKMEADKVGIPSISVEVYDKDKMELRDIYLGMSIVYGSKNEIIPVIQDTEGLEFLLTNTIRNMSGKQTRLIAYFQPLSEEEQVYYAGKQLPMPANIAVLNKMVSSFSVFDRTDLVFPLPESTDLLIVNAVKDSLTDTQLFNIDQFIMSGKPVMIFQDRYVADINMPNAILFDNNLISLLRHYEIFIKPSLVLDASCFQLTRNVNQSGTIVPTSFDYPFFPFIKTFSDSLLIHKNINYLYTYYSSEVVFSNRNNNLSVVPIISTSNNSFEMTGSPVGNGFELDTDFRKYLNMDFYQSFNHKSKHIANLFLGYYYSYFNGKVVNYPNFKSYTDSGIVFVAGSTSLLTNELLQNSQNNAAIILNIIDYLTGEPDFINMRNRNIAFSPIKEMSRTEKQFIKYINLYFPSIIVLIIGLVFYLIMQVHKQHIKDKVEKENKK